MVAFVVVHALVVFLARLLLLSCIYDCVVLIFSLLAFGIVTHMAFAKVWWSRNHFIHQMTIYGAIEIAKAQASWDAILTLCDNHDERRMRWRWLEGCTEKILKIRFQIQL